MVAARRVSFNFVRGGSWSIGNPQQADQFTLGEKCEVNLRQVLARDEYLKVRIAARLTEEPQYKSETPLNWSARLAESAGDCAK